MTRTLNVRNPRTGEFDYEITSADAETISSIANRLRQAQPDWVALTMQERAARLQKFAESLLADRALIGNALQADTGRKRIAHMEVDGVAGVVAGWCAQLDNLLPSGWTQGVRDPEIKHHPQFVPYDLVGVISPWNFPLTLSMIDTIPALLAGACVIIKPSEVTPRFADEVQKVIISSGLENVLSFVQGDGATGAALIDQVDAICFTGSVPTGRKVALSAAQNMIPAFLELGGKDPLIVLPSANIEHATDAALRGSVLSTGQACQSIERVYMHESMYPQFIEMLVTKANKVQLNWPDISAGEIGPIIFDKQADILKAHLEDAVIKGAEILTGGDIETHGGGLWLKPTVVTNVSHDMKIMTEETFGPIIPVMAYQTVEQAVQLANDTEFGLSAAVMGKTLEEAETVGRQINAGAVSLNDAALTSRFHEAEKHSFKLSGMGGSRMGPAGFQRFMRRKALIANTGAPLPLSAFSEDTN